MAGPIDVDDVILNFDPAAPQRRFRTMQLGAALRDDLMPRAVPWPAGWAPKPAPLPQAPAPTDSLSRFHGYDAVIVTWTAAEAAALAALLSPGVAVADWYEYRHDVAAYVPLVTGGRAPFNSSEKDMARYYHCLGLYYPCRIGTARVLLFKSGLHLDYDGPAVPVRRLMAEIAKAVAPRIFITTGTGGGIGTTTKLGDVVIAGTVRFDCTTQFKAQSWAKASYRTAALPAAALAALTPDLTGVNAALIPNARKTPKFYHETADAIVTTDFFGFDDSTDYYKLQGLGRACDMGDAMVADALQAFPAVAFHAIRNASDPQIANPDHNIETAGQEAAQIYARYGALTTAASVLASWAVVKAGATKAGAIKAGAMADENNNGQEGKVSKFKLGRLSRTYDPRVPHLSTLLAGQALKPPPASIDYTRKMPKSLGMMLNDTLGDCTCAAVYHAMQVWSFNAGAKMITEPNTDVEKLYILACGYNPRIAGEGPGGNEQHVLTYLLKTGAPVGSKGTTTQKILAFVEVDGRNTDDVKRTIVDCGVAYIGFSVPAFLMPADGAPPKVWEVEKTDTHLIGGHAVVLAGYDEEGARVISWGQYYTMTWGFFAKYVDEVYAIADPLWVAAKGTTPAGLTLAELEVQMRALTG